jgi:hypothetical protein
MDLLDFIKWKKEIYKRIRRDSWKPRVHGLALHRWIQVRRIINGWRKHLEKTTSALAAIQNNLKFLYEKMDAEG